MNTIFNGQVEPNSTKYFEFRVFLTSLFTTWEKEWEKNEEASTEDDQSESQRMRWKQNLLNPSARDIWKESTDLFSSNFVSQVDEIVDELELVSYRV